MLLGCIGDDFTGASDLGNTLTRAGMRCVQYVGVPDAPAAAGVEAGIVALKSRSIPVADAVAQSLQALDWLRAQGCRQFLFKYCSTFDSTPEGNIGPVAEALADALDARQVIFCPAFPAMGRSVYQGHLFVGDRLLNESGMQHHPLTPMTDPDIRRWLSRQARGSVGLVDAGIVRQGPDAIAQALAAQDAQGHRLIVTDAITDDDLLALGRAVAEQPIITGGSGIAMGLPANFAARGELAGSAAAWRAQPGPAVVLSGSCSQATRDQVARHRAAHPSRELRAEAVMAGDIHVDALADWAMAQAGVPLIYTSADPARVADSQARFGQAAIASAIEALFSGLARALVRRGCTGLICAGGETSGAIVSGLGLDTLEIGPEIATGVPAMRARPDLVLALKSGNFGGPDFFMDAAGVLKGAS
ncbi:3-oxo-tetronate kinase [Roseovarius autotrophicus]|uniref:3-oxo-tetronate kinase n=1 Tax=Roseovarius autotrophicus TaxID=2824121 RepID=UPI001B359C40|nr:3-oxo-tetronate kinase [Roseovarius autotrophicus]